MPRRIKRAPGACGRRWHVVSFPPRPPLARRPYAIGAVQRCAALRIPHTLDPAWCLPYAARPDPAGGPRRIQCERHRRQATSCALALQRNSHPTHTTTSGDQTTKSRDRWWLGPTSLVVATATPTRCRSDVLVVRIIQLQVRCMANHIFCRASGKASDPDPHSCRVYIVDLSIS